MKSSHKIAVLPGDGIGPEVMQEAVRVLDSACEKFGFGLDYSHADVGGVAIDRHGEALPADTLVAIPQLTLFCEEILGKNGKKREEIRKCFDEHKRTHEGLRAGWQEEVKKNWKGEPMSLPRLAHEIWQVIKITRRSCSKWE